MSPPRENPREHPNGQQPFVWPPRPAATTAPIPSATSAAERPAPTLSPANDGPPDRPRLVTWWREFERVWLAPTTPPLDEMARLADWHADEPGDFCDRCGTTLAEGEAAAGDFGCASCRNDPLVWDRLVRLGEFTGPLASWVARVKFTRCHWLGESLGRELARAIRRHAAVAPNERVVVVPVPMSWRHRVGSGIDHAGAIARGVATELGCDMVRALGREHRPTQRGLSPTAREQNVKGSMWPRRRLADGVTVLLIDDVCTTGATLRAAARALRRGTPEEAAPNRGQGPDLSPARRAKGWKGRLVACVVARTPDPDRRPLGPVGEGTVADGGGGPGQPYA